MWHKTLYTLGNFQLKDSYGEITHYEQLTVYFNNTDLLLDGQIKHCLPYVPCSMTQTFSYIFTYPHYTQNEKIFMHMLSIAWLLVKKKKRVKNVIKHISWDAQLLDMSLLNGVTLLSNFICHGNKPCCKVSSRLCCDQVIMEYTYDK